MKVYVIVWSWYEDYVPHYLVSEMNYSRELFEELCNKSLIKATEEELAHSDTWIGVNSLLERAVKIMKEKYGFRDPTDKELVQTEYWGSIILKEEDLYGEECRRTSLGFLPDEIKRRIVEHNKRVESRLSEKLEGKKL